MDAHAWIALCLVGALSFLSARLLEGGDLAWLARRLYGAAKGLRSIPFPVPLFLRRQGRELGRGTDVVLDMPTFLDIVTLGLSAGMSFDSSVELYCRRFQTVLAQRLWDALLLWRMGIRSRADALAEVAQEAQAPALQRFAQTVSESLAFGTPLAQTLERQAQVLRDEQRAQLEERIERVPVKMLVPLGTLIVPAMLLAILGPLLGPALGVA